MKRRLAALIALIGAAWAGAASAGTLVELRDTILDADGRVTLGELFDGAGAAENVQIANRTGPTVVLDAGEVQVFARHYGLDWDNPQGLRRIIIRQGADDAAPTVTASAGAPAARGTHNVEVLTYARSLAAGEVVQADDVVWSRAAAAPAGAPRDADAVIGMSARRPLREGAPVTLTDVTAPQVIRTGDTVVVTYSTGAVTLTLQGRAMSNATLGQPVSVRNLTSNRTFEAVASGPDAAVVGPEAQRLRGAPANQFAQR